MRQWNQLVIYFSQMGKDHFEIEAVMYINTHATLGYVQILFILDEIVC